MSQLIDITENWVLYLWFQSKCKQSTVQENHLHVYISMIYVVYIKYLLVVQCKKCT